jgi:hypothetical protein
MNELARYELEPLPVAFRQAQGERVTVQSST